MFSALVMTLGGGCAASHTEPPILVDCAPRTSPVYLFHTDEPWPRGRLHACETCVRIEDALLAREHELGCPLEGPADVCTLDGACDYAAVVEHEARVRAATRCDELAGLATEDPCRRPDSDPYWRDRRD